MNLSNTAKAVAVNRLFENVKDEKHAVEVYEVLNGAKDLRMAFRSAAGAKVRSAYSDYSLEELRREARKILKRVVGTKS